jgi:hypothetical protein
MFQNLLSGKLINKNFEMMMMTLAIILLFWED